MYYISFIKVIIVYYLIISISVIINKGGTAGNIASCPLTGKRFYFYNFVLQFQDKRRGCYGF